MGKILEINDSDNIDSPERKENISIKIFAVNFAVIAAFWGRWVFTTHYAVDSYSCYFADGDAGFGEISRNYRFFMGLFTILCGKLNMNRVTYQILFGCVSLLIIIAAVSILSIELLKYYPDKKKTWIYVDLGTLLIVGNFMMTEWFYFVECYMNWAAALSGAIFGAVFFSRKGALNKLISFVFLLLMCGTYQSAIALYVFIVMTYVFLKNDGKLSKKSVFQILGAAGILILAFAANMLLVKCFVSLNHLSTSERIDFSPEFILSSFKNVLYIQKQVFIQGFGVFPKYVLLVAAVLCIFAALFLYVKGKIGANSFLFALLTMFSGLITLYLTACVQVDFWFPMRVAATIFGFYSCAVWIIVFIISKSRSNVGEIITAAASFLCAFFLIADLIISHRILNDVITTNSSDKAYISRIEERIEEYESQSECTVTSIAFLCDKSITAKYFDSIYSKNYFGEMCEKSLFPDWSDLTSVNFYTGRNYTKINLSAVPASVYEYAQSKNWRAENLNEQLVFDGTSLYVIVY